MQITIDTESKEVFIKNESGSRAIDLYSNEAFYLLGQEWSKVAWAQKYPYTFTWLGRPMIQFPEDVLRVQEVVYNLKPDVIIETGVAHGGSLIFYASLCKMMGKGRVVGIDIEIREHNRKAIEAHELASYIFLIEGSSVDKSVVDRVEKMIKPGDTVFVMLDSNHTKDHVSKELEMYYPLVTKGSYIVASDGIMKDLVGAPRSQPDWADNNPTVASKEFAAAHPEFIIEQPGWSFNESTGLKENLTYWPGAWLRRV